jgi:hypothetical protein
MNANDPQPGNPHADPPPGRTGDRAWFGRRKRIVSREVASTSNGDSAAEVEAETRDAARGRLQPADVIDIPGLPAGPPPEAILDPTLFLERSRKRGQNLAYRMTQLVTLAATLSASAAIAFTFFDHRRRAMILAGAACLLSALSVQLVRRSRLARRLRGYAAASCILAVIASSIVFLPHLFNDDTKPIVPEKKTSPLDHPE